MSQALEKMVQQLSVQPLKPDVFQGDSTDLFGNGRIFGGQVLGQSLMASSLTVPPERQIHSLHSYFVRPGDVSKPIRFEVERVRDGGTFSNRLVATYQDDKHIFTMAASYQIEEPGFEHFDAMPADIQGPENFISEKDLVKQIPFPLPKSLTKRHIEDSNPIEIRPAHPDRILKGGDYPAFTYCWFRANGHLDPENTLLHKVTFAYLSDFYLLFTSLLPHQQSSFDPKMQMASLDHAIWYHRPINLNEWNVYVLESPNASGARGLSFGKVYNQQGQLLATTAQEGLIRNTTRFGHSE